ncbi:hypothetical protein QUF74_05040 [Candidatus Halobeggiatoa sp. HSG11]|nr:hypothetical protein [Candidatus Halobeggiatoa sp. HSG11]
MHFHNFFSSKTGFTILLIVSIVAGVGYSIFSLRQMHAETREFVNVAMLNLFSEWDETEFLNYTSNRMQKKLTNTKLQKINVVFTRLGKLLNYHGAYGGLFHSESSWLHVVVCYQVSGNFQGGKFAALVTLIKQRGDWTIAKFEYKYAYFPLERQLGSLKLVAIPENFNSRH